MADALGWGALAASSLIVGALLGLARPWPDRVVGAVLAFGAGALDKRRQFRPRPGRRPARRRRLRCARARRWGGHLLPGRPRRRTPRPASARKSVRRSGADRGCGDRARPRRLLGRHPRTAGARHRPRRRRRRQRRPAGRNLHLQPAGSGWLRHRHARLRSNPNHNRPPLDRGRGDLHARHRCRLWDRRQRLRRPPSRHQRLRRRGATGHADRLHDPRGSPPGRQSGWTGHGPRLRGRRRDSPAWAERHASGVLPARLTVSDRVRPTMARVSRRGRCCG